MRKINILTGPVQSGKTTRLSKWIKSFSNCAGILAPVRNNLRHVYSIHSGQSKLLEAKGNSYEEGDLIRIGKYRFIKANFEWAQNELLLAIKQMPEWIIIDEIGPLELDGKGLEPAVSAIIQQMLEYDQFKLIVVVRDKLLDLFLQSYELKDNDIEYLHI